MSLFTYSVFTSVTNVPSGTKSLYPVTNVLNYRNTVLTVPEYSLYHVTNVLNYRNAVLTKSKMCLITEIQRPYHVKNVINYQNTESLYHAKNMINYRKTGSLLRQKCD